MSGRATPLGAATVAAYLIALAVIQATGTPDWELLASSPEDVVHGKVWLLLTSGLVIEGLPWAQLSVLAVILAVALVRLGTGRLWTVALAAHMGATLVAYAGVGVLWLIDHETVVGTVDQPDYGVSVVLAGELGALAAGGGRRIALLVGAAALVGFGIGVADSSALANAEHLLGFVIGALTYICLDRYMPHRQYSSA
jgi:membrane associated rhomboid family serine protease